MDDSKWCFEKNLLSLQKFDVWSRSFNSSCSQKLQYNERTILFRKSPLQMYLLCLMSNGNCCCEIVKLTESNFWNSPFKVEMSTIVLLKHLLYLMNIFSRCCEIVKLTHSPRKNGISVSAFTHLARYFSNKNYPNYFCGINRYL